MLKKTIKYVDYNGKEREEDFYFNLNKSELTEWQLSKDGGLDAALERIIKEERVPELIEMIKEIILKAYGEKSDDGKHFLKSEEISHKFYCSEAYSELFMQIAASPEAAASFIKDCLPEEIRKQIEETTKEQAATTGTNA